MTDLNPARGLWTKKAMAFAVRSHRHLWGKNNEEPLAFLFTQGLSNALAKTLYLGWNKFGQDRPCANWGLDRPDDFFIPSGIVFPHIRNKDLVAVYVISMDEVTDTGSFTDMLPGSDPRPIRLGPDPAPCCETFQDLLQGLVFFQDHPDQGVIITPAVRP